MNLNQQPVLTNNAYRTIQGDISQPEKLFPNHNVLIIHGCNNRGVMGAGVAKALYSRWPAVKENYLEHCRPFINNNLHVPVGTTDIVSPTTNVSVINAITQDGFGPGDRQYVDYDAIDKVFDHTVYMLTVFPTVYDIFAFPKIGAGLAGGDWDVISKIINKHVSRLKLTTPYLVEYNE